MFSTPFSLSTVSALLLLHSSHQITPERQPPHSWQYTKMGAFQRWALNLTIRTEKACRTAAKAVCWHQSPPFHAPPCTALHNAVFGDECAGGHNGARGSPILRESVLVLLTATKHLAPFPQAKRLAEQEHQGRATTHVTCIPILPKPVVFGGNLMLQLLCWQSTSHSANCKIKKNLCKSNHQGRL